METLPISNLCEVLGSFAMELKMSSTNFGSFAMEFNKKVQQTYFQSIFGSSWRSLCCLFFYLVGALSHTEHHVGPGGTHISSIIIK